MDDVPGSMGTSARFSLRLGQTIFSSASLFFMALGVQFYSYTAFCYLVTIMGLTIPWSFTLTIVDRYSVLVKWPIRQPRILLIVIIGNWVLSILILAAACSAASVVDLLLHSDGSFCPLKVAVGIKYLLLWHSYLDFCLWLHLCSISGYFPPCDFKADFLCPSTKF